MKNKKYIFYILIITLVFLLGAYFRIKAYLFVRPIWIDECWLFFNIYELSYTELFGALKHAQSAPPIFLVISKFMISQFGIKETVFRFLPLVSSLISIPVFYKFSKIFLEKKISIILANILFAINIQLITYSQEFKQYSSDVLITMLLFILLYKISIRKITFKQMLLYATLTIICPLISLPSYFIFSGWFLRELLKSKKENIIKLFMIQLPMLLITIPYYLFALKKQRLFMMTYVYEYWKNTFITTNLQDNINLLITNFNFFFHPCNNTLAQIILLLVGFSIFMIQKNKEVCKLLFFPLIPIFICSVLKLYPTHERIILYLIPGLIVLMIKCIDFITLKHKLYSCFIAIIFIFAFGNYNLQYLNDCNNNKYGRFEHIYIKGLFKKLKDYYNPQDTVFVNNTSAMEYLYYKLYYDFHPTKEIFMPFHKEITKFEYHKVFNDLIKAPENYWVFLPNDYDLFYSELVKVKNTNSSKEIKEYKIQNSYLLYMKNKYKDVK